MSRSLFLVFMAVCAGMPPAISKAQESKALDAKNEEETQTLEAVTVTAEPARAETEGSRSYTTGLTNSATGLSLSIKETPQSVTVVTRQRLDDQQLQSVGDVLNATTGISVNVQDYRSSYYSRGFSITSSQFDGIPTNFANGVKDLDTGFYDRVEVVRGSTGLRTGAGNPSASINLVRKRPTRDFQGNVSLSAGSWDNYRGLFDLSTPLVEDGRIRARIVGVHQDSKSFIDQYKTKKDAFYGVIDADLTPATTLSVGYDYQDIHLNGVPWGGLPMYFSDGTRASWSRSKTGYANWAHDDSRITTAFASIEHRFDSGWKLRGAFNRGTIKSDAELFSFNGKVDRQTGYLDQGNALASYSDTRQSSYDVIASGPFNLLGRRHELVVGASHSRSVANGASTGQSIYINPPAGLGPIADFYNYDGNFPRPDFSSLAYTPNQTTIKQSGVYAAGRFSLADPLTLVIGGRLSNYSNDTPTSKPAVSFKKNNQFVPYVGMIWDINDTYSAYVSHTSIFNPQTQLDKYGNTLSPTTGKTNEVGLKASYFEDRINASLSLFESKLNNVAQQDPDNKTPQGGTAYYAVSGTKSRGIELDIQGEVTPNWNLFAGISHFTASTATGARLSPTIPRTTAKLFTTYRLPGDWNRLTVGGGISWQSRMFYSAANPDAAGQSSYSLTSLMARYEISNNANLTLNVNNVFDKTYFTMVGFFNQQLYGAPRNAQLTFNYKF